MSGMELEAIMDSLEDAILSVDEQWRVIFLNRAAARLFGCARPPGGISPAPAPPAIAAALEQLKLRTSPPSSPAAPAVRRIELKRPDGTACPIEAVIACSARSGRSFYTLMLRDLSLPRPAEQALARAHQSRVIGALAGGLAREFNDLLAGLLSHLDQAAGAPELPLSLKPCLSEARAASRRGAELVRQFQLLSRPDAAQLAPVDLPGLIDQVVFLLRRCVDHHIQIKSVPLATKPWPVKASDTQLLEVLAHLGLNARDAMPNGGQLSFKLENTTFRETEVQPPRKAGDFVRVSVKDTGRGIPPEVLNHLSEPGFTGSGEGKALADGLLVLRNIVARHGGWMEIESRAGSGTQVHLFLPRGQEHAVAQPRPAVPAIRERVLVADDEQLVRMVMRAVLGSRGYQIVEAVDGEDAVQKCRQAPGAFDLVLMDLRMPKLSGREALLRIRQSNPHIRAILLSGGLQEEDPADTAGLEGVTFLPKPFENQELLRLVRESLDRGSEPPA